MAVRLSRPALILPRRKALVTGAAALAMAAALPRAAHAAPTTWDPANASYLTMLSSDYLTITNSQFTITWAVDTTGGTMKVWQHNSVTDKWNDAVLASQNPATATGGYTPSGINGTTWYPMVLMQGASVNVFRINCGATTIPALPSGFQTLNQVAGATVTFDTSWNTQFTYSDGNLVATRAGAAGSDLIGRTTHGFGTGVKVCWEVHYLDLSSLFTGFGNSSVSKTSYMHDAGNNGVSSLGTYYYSNTNSGVSSYGSTATSVPHLTKATNARSRGKLMFEVDLHYGAVECSIGVAQTSVALTISPGNTGSFAYLRNNSSAQTSNNGTNTTGRDAVASGGKLALYFNLDASPRQAFYRPAGAGRYNTDNTADPATGAGAIDISALTGPLIPVVGTGNTSVGAGLTKAANCNFAGSFSNPQPSGYIPWNDGTLGGQRSRIILGQNSPTRQALRALLAA